MDDNEVHIFFNFIINNENIIDWKLKWEDTQEGYCSYKDKIIYIGKKAKEDDIYLKWLILHEITHVLIDDDHYSKEFNEKMVDLCKKYCSRKERKKIQKYIMIYSFIFDKKENITKKIKKAIKKILWFLYIIPILIIFGILFGLSSASKEYKNYINEKEDEKNVKN